MISVKNITKIYGSQKALDDVSFEIGTGKVIGFLGPNGAGKSTMMKILTCFIPQTSGQASVGGFDVNEQAIEVKKIVGYLPEHNPLYPEMYVKEYLNYICEVYKFQGNKVSKVKELIELTGLTIEQNKKIGTLSKGYRQRVGLAQALIHDPKVLILDEPTSGLDPNQLTEIRSLIKSIGKEKTVVLSTHIMQEVEAICDRVIIINKGKIVANENTDVLQKRNLSGENILVEFDKEVSLSQLKKVEGVIDGELIGKCKWRLIIKDLETRSHLFKWAVANNYTVLSQQVEEQRMEDIFQELTKK